MSRGVHRPDKMDNRSSLYSQSACFWSGVSPATDDDEYTSTPIDLNGVVAGDEIWIAGGDQLFMAGIANVALTQLAAGSTVIYTIVGEDQFGDTVQEDITIVGSATESSLYCYRKIETITMIGGSGTPLGASDTLKVGHVTAGGVFRLPTYCRNPSAGQIKAVVWEKATTASAAPASVDAVHNCVVMTAGYSVGGAYLMHLDKDYDARS